MNTRQCGHLFSVQSHVRSDLNILQTHPRKNQYVSLRVLPLLIKKSETKHGDVSCFLFGVTCFVSSWDGFARPPCVSSACHSPREKTGRELADETVRNSNVCACPISCMMLLTWRNSTKPRTHAFGSASRSVQHPCFNSTPSQHGTPPDFMFQVSTSPLSSQSTW